MDTDKYKARYRVASARLEGWDYGSNAAYFVTICTHNRIHLFGEVIEGQMQLTSLGQAAWDCWDAIPDHFPFVILDAFVVMPNHVHGIVIINKPVETQVETQHLASLPAFLHSLAPKNRFGPQSQNLASIVRGFKIGVTTHARQNQIERVWQARYHDHIVRNAPEYQRIRTYIIENPQRWMVDTFYD